MQKLLILVCLSVPLFLSVSADDGSVFDGFKGMLPENIVKDMVALKAEDVAAVKRIMETIHKSDDFMKAIAKESPRVSALLKDVVEGLKKRRDEAYSQFIPETKTFIGKLRNIGVRSIAEAVVLYKLEKPAVKEELKTIFPKTMFIIEREFLK